MSSAAPDARKKLADSDEVLQECARVETELAELKAAYDLYFLGQERMPPSRAHQNLKRRIASLRSVFVRHTAAKFRVQSLETKFGAYERLWARNLQEIENGTFRRDLARMKRKKQPTASASSPSPDALTTQTMDTIDPHLSVPVPSQLGIHAAPTQGAMTAAPAVQPVSKSASLGPATATSSGGLSEEKLKALYNAYLTAKKRCNEDVSKLSYDGLAASIRKQVPALLEQHQAQAVDFKVVIKDGKAVLRAVPK